MNDSIFKGLFDTDLTTVISLNEFLLCIIVSLILGILLGISYMIRNRYTKSFVLCLSILPAIVCVVIMMVNGNVGTGVAVAGAFSLVRFRSAPGNAKEIAAIFLAMGAGLIAGMGYLGFAAIYTVIMCLFFILFSFLNLGTTKNAAKYKVLSITIPEDLNYSDIFDDIFNQYTNSVELIRVKTTNMGSMYKLTYNITLKDIKSEKEMIDKIRCRNGNLEISVSKQDTTIAEL